MSEWTEEARATGRLIFEVLRLNNVLMLDAEALIADLGLTPARWQVLGTISYLKQPDTVAGLARRLGLARQSVQRVVGDMAALGLVTLAENPSHKRAKLVELTAQGRAVMAAAEARRRPWTAGLAKGLEGLNIAAAEAVLVALRQRMQAKGAD
jgi:DNA-binding MarR family transcriptional regulator